MGRGALAADGAKGAAVDAVAPSEQWGLLQFGNARVLCVAAHPDDEVLGCGATLSRAAEAGADVRILLPVKRCDLRGEANWELHLQQFSAAAQHLGGEAIISENSIPELHIEAETMALHALIEPWADWCDIVFTHWHGDAHQAHRAVARAVEVATRPFRRRRQVLQYEVPTSTEQAFRNTFAPNLFISVNEHHVARKAEAMALYTTEQAPGRNPQSVERWAAVRGEQVGVPYAETFVIARAFV
jgi:LmbE family N-acetylglucosaminyl deacetylase